MFFSLYNNNNNNNNNDNYCKRINNDMVIMVKMATENDCDDGDLYKSNTIG